MKNKFNLIIVLGLLSLDTFAYRTGKEGGNQLLLPNGDTVYRTKTCTNELTLKNFIEENDLLDHYKTHQNTIEKFSPGLIMSPSERKERVCVTERPIGPLLGLGESHLRVMGYIPNYRGDQELFKEQVPYIFIDQDFLKDSIQNKKEQVLAEVLFAELLHGFLKNDNYTTSLFMVEDAMKLIVDYSNKEFTSENLLSFNHALNELNFPNMTNTPLTTSSIAEMNKYMTLSEGLIKIELNDRMENNEKMNHENFLDQFFDPTKQEEVSLFVKLITKYNIDIYLSRMATDYFFNKYAISSYAEETRSELIFNIKPEIRIFYPKRNLALLDELQKEFNWSQHFSFNQDYFTNQKAVDGNYFNMDYFGYLHYRDKRYAANIAKMIKNGILDKNQSSKVFFLGVPNLPVSQALLTTVQVQIDHSRMNGKSPNPRGLVVEKIILEDLF